MLGVFDVQVTNHLSGMVILVNTPDQDYSLKFVSGDRSKNVTVARFKGPDAEAAAQAYYFFFQSMWQIAGISGVE